MGETTGIGWTDCTANWWIGCERVSPACDFCYADRDSKRLAAQHGLKLWEGDRYITRTAEANVRKWNKRALADGVRRRCFCMSFGDIFEKNERWDEALDHIRRTVAWPVMQECQQLDFQLLTKRPENIAEMIPPAWLDQAPPNVWYGVTAEDQQHLEDRWAHLEKIPAVVRFLSVEPMLGRVQLGDRMPDWVICGGESGPHARAFNVDAAGWLRRECAQKGVPFFMKQLGAKPITEIGGQSFEPILLKDRHGADWDEWPTDVPRVREFPTPALAARIVRADATV
jgi:protein gp37